MDSPPRRSSRYSESPSPRRSSRGRSRSRTPVLRRSRTPPLRRDRASSKEDALNPGNNLYVTGLSTRVTEKDLEEHFSREGKVIECRLVVDPRTRESRGFGFVTMDCGDDADRCVKYLNRSTLEGRIITVEKLLQGLSVCVH
jgi:transformer-2 protein